MWWKRGWLLNSLNYQIEKNLRETVFKNKVYREKKWGLFERQVLRWSTHPVRYTLLLSIAYVLNCVALDFWLPELKQVFPSWTRPWGDIAVWQSNIFAGQLTVIGLIFPLVVGFVGLLLQNRTSNRALWGIFRRYSGFMFVGYSGLALAGVIILVQFLHPWLPVRFDNIISFGLAVWFLFNLVLVGWFLFATFRFISIDSKNNLVQRFCINELLISEIRSSSSLTLSMNLQESGLVPRYGLEDGGAKSIMHYCYRKKFADSFTRKFRRKKFLNNIYGRVLSAMICGWFMNARNEKGCLELPAVGMARPSDQWVVAQSTTRMKKSWKILLWLAYSFRTKPVFPIENIKPVLNAIVSEVFDAIKADNHKNFEDAVGELEEWASDIICTTAYTRPNGEKSSWLLLGRDAFGGVSLLRQLSIEYYEMSKAIRVNTRDYSKYLRTLSYFHLNIFGSLWEHMAPVLITEKINDHYRMWSTVVDPIGFKGRDRLSREIIESHERSLSVFVGAWEHWGRLLPKQPKAWEDCKKISEPFMTHLRDTAFMIVDSLRVGDKMASNWAADMLVYWYESAFIGREANTFMYSGAFISYTILGIDQGNRTREFGQHDGELAADVAMNLAIRNAWFDVRLIVATYVLKRARDNGEDVVDLIKALVENNRLLPSGAFGRHQNGVASGKSIVEAYIHQRWTGRGDGTRYTNWLDGFVERLGEIEETPRVIGRVYSSRGADSIWSLREMYRVLAVYYSGLEWRLSSSMRAYLLSDLFGFEKRRDLLVELDWLMSIEAQELAHYDYLIENNDSLKLRLQNYKTSIDKLSAEIRNTNEQELATGEYDNNRLITFGKLASSGVFSRDSGPVPLTLFREIRFVQSLDESFRRKCSIANYPKSDLVTNITVTRAVNDEDWVRDFFRGVLEEMLYRAMLGGINFEEVAEESIHGIVKSLVQRSRDISNQGDTPVLFVGHRDLDNMLDRALFGSESELDASLVVRKNDGYPSRYICHLDSIEIYRMPPGGVEHSLLLPKSSFKTLDVQEFDQNRYVDVQPQPVVSDANEVTLEFVFFMKPEFLQGDSYRFVMNNSNSS